MNKKIVTLAALLSLGLAACGPTESTSSSSPVDTGDTGDSTSEVKPQTTYAAVTINNKDDMQDPWYMPGAPMREMSITAKISDTENGNVMQMISDGVMTITSSDPTVASIMGINVKPLKAGKTTITVTVKNPSGTISDSMELDILADTFTTGAPKVVDPEAGKEYRLGALSTYFNYWVYATGAMSSYYLGTNTNFAQAMLVEPEQVKDDKGTVVANQWYLKISATPDVSNKGMYLAAIKDGSHINPSIALPENKSVWTYDTEDKTFSTEVDKATYYLGADDDNKTLNVVSEDDIDGGFYFKASLLEWDENGTAPTITAPKIDAGEATEIATLADQKEEDRDYKKLYRVTGILEDKDPTDAYANAYLTDPETGKSLQIYGISDTRDAIVADGEAIVFTNPQHGSVAPLKDIPNGVEVTMDIIRCVGYNNYTAIMVEYDETVDQNDKYKVTIPEATEVKNGTVSVDKTEAAYGETVTVTVTPNEGYQVNSVAAKTAYGTVTAKKGEDGKYTFAATVVNNVVVSIGKIGKPVAEDPEDGFTGKFGLYQSTLGKYLYMTGVIDNHYPTTVDDYDEGADVEVKASGNKWTIQVTSGESANKYLAAEASGKYNNLVFTDTAYEWSWDAENKYFYTNLGSDDLYIGNYKDFDTLSLSKTSYASEKGNNKAVLFSWDSNPIDLTNAYNITIDGLGVASQKYADGTATIDNLAVSYTEIGNYGNGIQWRYKNEKASAIWNTSATKAPIESIELYWNNEKASNPDADLSVTFGTAVITEDAAVANVKYTEGATVATIVCDVEGATFFRINHGTVSGAFYINQIVIRYAA